MENTQKMLKNWEKLNYELNQSFHFEYFLDLNSERIIAPIIGKENYNGVYNHAKNDMFLNKLSNPLYGGYDPSLAVIAYEKIIKKCISVNNLELTRNLLKEIIVGFMKWKYEKYSKMVDFERLKEPLNKLYVDDNESLSEIYAKKRVLKIKNALKEVCGSLKMFFNYKIKGIPIWVFIAVLSGILLLLHSGLLNKEYIIQILKESGVNINILCLNT